MTALSDNNRPKGPSDRDDPPDFIEENAPERAITPKDPDGPLVDPLDPDTGPRDPISEDDATDTPHDHQRSN